MAWVYKSRLRVLFDRSNLMVYFTSQIYMTSFKIKVANRDYDRVIPSQILRFVLESCFLFYFTVEFTTLL